MAKANPAAAAAIAAAKSAANAVAIPVSTVAIPAAKNTGGVPVGFQEPAAPVTNVVNPPIVDEKAAKKAEEIAAIAKAKQDAKDAKAKIAADKKAAAEAAKAEKAEAKAVAKAERDARIAELAASGKTYTGSMLSLADKVKQGVYVKGASGQLRSNDDLALALDGVAPTNVVRIGLDLLKLEENPYAKLNVGQQSMNLRNRLRGAIKKGTVALTDIADYIKRNEIPVTSAADVAAAAKEKADKKAAAFFAAQEAKKAKAEAEKTAAEAVKAE